MNFPKSIWSAKKKKSKIHNRSLNLSRCVTSVPKLIKLVIQVLKVVRVCHSSPWNNLDWFWRWFWACSKILKKIVQKLWSTRSLNKVVGAHDYVSFHKLGFNLGRWEKIYIHKIFSWTLIILSRLPLLWCIYTIFFGSFEEFGRLRDIFMV
jgi:hypothetical protein